VFDFRGKVVLITGAAQGFGRVCAGAFAEQGAKVAICDINDDGGAETLRQIEAAGAEGLYVHADVADEDEVAAFVIERSRPSVGWMSRSTTPPRRSPVRLSTFRPRTSTCWSTPISRVLTTA
jgi:short chain dehydrogenase